MLLLAIILCALIHLLFVILLVLMILSVVPRVLIEVASGLMTRLIIENVMWTLPGPVTLL